MVQLMFTAYGATWRAEYGEINDKPLFRFGYKGDVGWEYTATVEWLQGLVEILEAVQPLPVGQLVKGPVFQARKRQNLHQDVVVEPRSDTSYPTQYFDLYSEELNDLILTLKDLAARIPNEDPEDWDSSKQETIILDIAKIESSLVRLEEEDVRLGGAVDDLSSQKVDKTTTVNGHPLSGDVVLTADDFDFPGVPELVEELNQKVDKTTTVNGHPLSENIVLTENDIDLSSFYRRNSLGLVLVEDFPKEPSDVSDTQRIQRAVDYALDNDLAGVLFGPILYDITTPVKITRSVVGFTFQGHRGRTRFWRDSAHSAGTVSGALMLAPDIGQEIENVTFKGLSFEGGLENESEFRGVRMRSESHSSPNIDLPAGHGITATWPLSRIVTAIRAYGNRTGSTTYGVCRNVYVKECDFYGTTSLPVFFNRVHGTARVEDCFIKRCLDTGWIFTETCEMFNSRVEFSMDNGMSLSRGAGNVKAIGNTVENSWFNGIWAGGFESDSQTGDVQITNNHINMSGQHGIYLPISSSSQVNISDNEIMYTRTRYGSGGTNGVGIYVQNYNEDIFVRGCVISNNLIRVCERSGIFAVRVAWATITGNVLEQVSKNEQAGNPGELSPSTTSLVGIAVVGTQGSTFRSVVANNVIADSSSGAIDRNSYSVYVNHASTANHQVNGNAIIGYLPVGRL